MPIVNENYTDQLSNDSGYGGIDSVKRFTAKEFSDLISANNASANQSTETGLKLLYEAGYSPSEAAKLWNDAFGTNFTAKDYTTSLNNYGIQKTDRPQLAVFGDSISSSVGYAVDGKGGGYSDNTYGNNLAQYLGQALKVNAANNAMGGTTTNDSLNGTGIPYAGKILPIEYGSFANYITQNKPETALLRFGAADAIRLNDPATTLKNIENMVQLSKENGTKPILVGVTPFAKMGDFNAGNIDAGITDSMIASADTINKGIKDLAEKYGVQFIDVRQVPVTQGALLDGVHPNAQYGAALNDYIASQINSAGIFNTQNAGSRETTAMTTAPAAIAPSSNTTANTITDYQGKSYDSSTILNLSKQIAAAIDPKAIQGGVFSTKGESVGFNYDQATKLLGRPPNAAEQVVLDMARHLSNEGVTDIKDADLSETSRRFGSTFTGGGGTIYEIKKDASGNPVISTWSKDTSDRGTILGALAIAGLAFGVPSLLGEATAATAGLTTSELAAADLALGGIGGTAGATALAEAAALGSVGALGTSALANTTTGLLTGAETSVAGMGAGTGLTAGGSGLGLSSTGGLGLTAAEGLTGTGVLSGSTLGTGLLGGSGTLAGLTGTGILAGSELGTGLLGTTGTQALTGTGLLSGSTLGTELLGTGAGTAATTGGVTGLTNTANLGTGALTTGVDSALLSSYVTPQAMAAKIGANLPSGWENFTAQEKISWFNANNVTAEQLLTAGVPQSEVAFMIENGLGGTVAGMGAGTGITAGAGGLGLNAGTAGLGAEGLGAGITAGTGLTGTGVLTGSTLGTGLLGTTGTGALTGTGVLAGSTLGTGLLGTGAGTAVTTGGVTGLTGVSNLGTGALTTGVTGGTTGGVTGVTGGTTGSTTGVTGGTGLLSGVTTDQLSKLISGGLSTVGGLLQQQTSREAAQAAQARIDAETAAAKQAAQFRPVGMTTRFGTSQFTYDPVTGQMVSAGYQLTPEAKAQQDRLMALSNQSLTQAEQAQSQFAPLQTGAQSLFNLGNKYLAQTPEEVAQRYINQQMQLLQPSRELELANLQNRLQQQGRAGLSVAQGGNLGATTPELQALYNARAQQELALAAQAQQAGQQQVSFGAGLLGQGAGAMGQYYAGQQAAYAPYTTAMGQAQGLEAIGQQPFALSQGLAQQQAQAGANAGRIGLTGAQLSTALATSNAATTNPYATVLGGLGSPTSLLGQGLANWTTGLLSSPTTAAAGNPLAVGEFANPGYWT